MTKRLVEWMGGVIGVESAVGKGSVFWIELDLTTEPQPVAGAAGPADVVPAQAQAGAQLRTLLYVEDNPANLMLVEDLIARRPDIRLLSARDGNRGIEVARATLPDVILMDINLPGISGIEALRILAEDPATAHIPVIALSANAMPRDIEKGLEAGFFRYLTKPIKVNEFMETLDVALKFANNAVGPRQWGENSMMVSASDILAARILIVDDQEPNVSLLEQLLSEAGYSGVTSTMNPQEVCALHRKNRYDLILLDLQMPGMDGFQVMEGLKTNDADGYLPVLVLTAQPGHKLRALQAGAKDFISKPFDLVEVKTRIHNMLEVRLLYKQLENFNKVLEQTVRERTAELRESEARYRSLTELASDWYWEQDETGAFTKVSGPVLEMLGIRVDPLAGQDRRWQDDGLERGGAGAAAGKDCRPAAVPGFRVQPRQCRRLRSEISGQRRADVQPGLPLHRLPRHRRRADCQRNRTRDPDGSPCRCRIAPIRTTFSPRCPRRNSSACCRTWSSSRCCSVKPCTSRAASCSTSISPPRPSCRCSMSWSPAHRPRSRAWATRAFSAFRCSWAAIPRPARRSCRPRATATASRGALLKEEFDRAGLMQRLLLRYTQALLTQMCQTAACNRHHSIEQQLCRWLLLTLDRLPSQELVMTQELVAGALGVRRESITEAAGNLQRAGVVRYRRGHIAVLDRSGLEAGACECYAVVKKEMARLLSDVRYRQDTRRRRCLTPAAGGPRYRGLPASMFAAAQNAAALSA